jgi:hypothetical protein
MPMFVTRPKIVTLDNAVQPLNIDVPIFVTEAGIVIDDNFLH